MLSLCFSPFPAEMMKSREVSAGNSIDGHNVHKPEQGGTESDDKISSSFSRVEEEKSNPWHDNSYAKKEKK